MKDLGRSLFVASDVHNLSYQWEWLGLPIIQLPTDVMLVQQIIWETKPDLIIETGIARGGSVIFHSSLLELLGRGKVVAIDIDIRAHNRAAIEAHPLGHRVHMIEGSSVDERVIRQVEALAEKAEQVMVVLDSNHTHEHVLKELQFYSPFVSPGSFVVVADTIIEYIPPQEHRKRPWGPGNNPATAVREFLASNAGFVVDPEVDALTFFSSNPGGYLRRVV